MKKGLSLFVILIAVLIVASIGASPAVDVLTQEDVCPNDGGWTKIDSGDLSLYPVQGAVEYCFKAGHWDTVSSIPEGGFGQDGSCEDGIQYCELSNWSYRLDDPTQTPTDEPTPTDTPEEPTPTDTPDDPTPTDTPEEPTPTDTPDDPTPTDTPEEPTPTNTPEEPTPTNTPEPISTPTPYDHPPTGPDDSVIDSLISNPVFVGGFIFLGLVLVTIGLILIWGRKVGIG